MRELATPLQRGPSRKRGCPGVRSTVRRQPERRGGTPVNETTNSVRQRPARGQPRWVGTFVCALLLVLGNLVTGYLVFLAYAVGPTGPWDSEGLAHAKYAAGLGLALVTALLSWVFVKAEWMGRGWFAAPAVPAVAALLRLTLLAPSLPRSLALTRARTAACGGPPASECRSRARASAVVDGRLRQFHALLGRHGPAPGEGGPGRRPGIGAGVRAGHGARGWAFGGEHVRGPVRRLPRRPAYVPCSRPSPAFCSP